MTSRIAVILLLALGCSHLHAQLYVTADFLALNRKDSAAKVFAIDSSGAVALGASDVDLEFAPAGQVTIGRRYDGIGFEASYLTAGMWSQAASAFDPATMLVSPLTGGLNQSVSVTYDSEFSSAEAYTLEEIYCGRNGSASIALGARYFTLDESMQLVAEGMMAQDTLNVTTSNMMLAPQLGTLIEYPCGDQGALNLAFKCGLGWNQAEMDQVFNDGTNPLATGADDGGSAALFSDIAIDYMAHVRPNLSIRIGYRFIGIIGAALAIETYKNNQTLLQNGQATLEADSSVVYQAPFMSVVWFR